MSDQGSVGRDHGAPVLEFRSGVSTSQLVDLYVRAAAVKGTELEPSLASSFIGRRISTLMEKGMTALTARGHLAAAVIESSGLTLPEIP